VEIKKERVGAGKNLRKEGLQRFFVAGTGYVFAVAA
jgi:hypothetical protein